MDDLISKRSATERLIIAKTLLETVLQELPTAELSEYCDQLWKTAYERGKAEAHPKKGNWKHRKTWSMYVCDQCSFESREASRYCPNCGARMEVFNG